MALFTFPDFLDNLVSVTLPKRVEHLTENVAKMRDSRLNMNTERVVETFSMVISKVKLDLMDNSCNLARQLNQIFFESVDYSHLFDGSLSKSQKQRILRVAVETIDKFICTVVVF